MTQSKYDLFYAEKDLGVLNTKAIARTTGSGLYVTIRQEHTDSATGEVSTDHILLFPEMIEKLIVMMTDAKAQAFAVDHTRENVLRIITEFHGLDDETADHILCEAAEDGSTVFASETQRDHGWPIVYEVTSSNDQYFITMVTSA